MTRFNYATLLLFPLILGIITSCHSVSDTNECLLQRAEQCMDTQPDSALHLLESVSFQSHVLKDEALARYYLLLTEARDKNYKDLSMDSSVVYSVNFFKEKGDKVQYGKAMYYYGRVIQMSGSQLRATKIYLDACSILEEAKEYRILGLMSLDMSVFHRNQSLYDNAERYSQDAIHYSCLAKDTLGMAFAYQALGEAFFLKQQLDSAFKYTHESLHILHNNPIRLEINASKLFALIYCQKGEYDKAEKILLDIIKEEPDDAKRIYHCITLGHLYQEQGKIHEARKYLMVCLESPSLFTRSKAYSYLAELSKGENEYKQAFSYKEMADSLHYLAENQNMHESLEQLQAKYATEKFQRESAQAQLEKRTILFCGCLVLILLLACIYYFYREFYKVQIQYKKTRKQLEKNREKTVGYKKKIELYKRQQLNTDATFKNEIEKLTRKIDELTEDSNRLRDKLDVSVLIKMLKQGGIIAECLTPDEWNRIYGLVNSLYKNVLNRLKDKYGQLTEHDVQVLAFLLLHFTSNELVILFDSKNGKTLSKAKQRIKEHLGMGAGISLDIFLQKCRTGKII